MTQPAWPYCAPLGSLGEVPVTYHEIPEGRAGTAATIEAMTRLALEGSRHQGIVSVAQRIAQGQGRKDYRSTLAAVHDYVAQHVQYVLDPHSMEQVAHPAYTLFHSGVGDCDDMAVVVVALAMALGFGGRFRTVSADPRRPEEWSHVYALVGCRPPELRGKEWWMASDPTEPHGAGWEPGGVWGVTDWPVANP